MGAAESIYLVEHCFCYVDMSCFVCACVRVYIYTYIMMLPSQPRSHGVHFTRMGREYTGLSVSVALLNALFGLGDTHPTHGAAANTIPGLSSAAAPAAALHPAVGPAPPPPPRPPCGQPPAKLDPNVPNVLLIGDSISMGYAFYQDRPQKPAGYSLPDGRLGYGLYVKEMLANVTANWTLASVQHNGGWWLGGQAGDTKLGKGCIKSWLGSTNASTADAAYLPWDVVHVNFGLHDLNDNGKEVAIAEYVANLRLIFTELKKIPTAKLIFTTTTPVPLGDGGGTRTEANVLKYNEAALQLLAPDIASGRVAVNDLHGDVVSRCGANYTATGYCELQIPRNVHYVYEGRQYCALSVVNSILRALYKFGMPL